MDTTPLRLDDLPDVTLPTAEAPPPPDELLVRLWLHGRPASTVKVYLLAIADLQRSTGGKPFAAVTLADLQEHADGLAPLAPATRAKRLAAVKSLFGFAAKLGYLQVDPARALRLPRRPDTLASRILEPAAVATIIAAESDPRRRLLLRLFYASGARISEVVALRWEDCHAHGDSGVITLQAAKGGKPRTVRLPAPVWVELAALRPAEGGGPVFASERYRERPVDAATAWRWFKAAAARGGVPAPSPHWFRHAHASHALDGGAPVHLVATTLGHASLATTSRYAHARPGESSGDYLEDLSSQG